MLITELENQLVTLRSKITLLEAQLEAERERTRNLQEERDEAIRGMAKAVNECEGMRSENKALKAEIASLKKQFQDHAKHIYKPSTKTVKDRIKDEVDLERRRDLAPKTRVSRETQIETNRSFIHVFH
jgi:DNA repair exonuclease SbcCD ATPase subunit